MALNITNGSAAAEPLSASGVPGDVLSWQDVLHEGPVPAGLSLEELSMVRARFLAECPWGITFDDVFADLSRRDTKLRNFKRHQEVVLWFEHDLFDQLQLLQLLAWFAQRDLGATRLSLICVGEFPGIEPFHGLGQLSPEQMASLFDGRQEVSRRQLELGQRAWDAFCCDHPRNLVALCEQDLAILPFLKAALLRLLEQYPSAEDGLSRSERQILDAVRRGVGQLQPLFHASQIDAEERPFMGDSVFMLHLRDLCAGEARLLELADGGTFPLGGGLPNLSAELQLTRAALRVLAGEADRVDLLGIDRWLGGVHLTGRSTRWRWSARKRALVGR